MKFGQLIEYNIKVRIHCEIFLSDYFMKQSFMHISLHIIGFHEIHLKYVKRNPSRTIVLFFPDCFTRDENGKNAFSEEFSCSSTINESRTGTLFRILNYSTEHLKVPSNHRQLFVKDGKEKSFSQETSKNLKGIPCYPSKKCKSLPEHLILPSILPGCLSLSSSRLYSRTRQYPIKKHLILSVCPDFVLSRTPPNSLAKAHLRTSFLQNSFKCQLKGKTEANFHTSSELHTLKIL